MDSLPSSILFCLSLLPLEMSRHVRNEIESEKFSQSISSLPPEERKKKKHFLSFLLTSEVIAPSSLSLLAKTVITGKGK